MSYAGDLSENIWQDDVNILDWRPFTGGVKDQGMCAAGWAFAESALVETIMRAVKDSLDLELSPQYILDCAGPED